MSKQISTKIDYRISDLSFTPPFDGGEFEIIGDFRVKIVAGEDFDTEAAIKEFHEFILEMSNLEWAGKNANIVDVMKIFRAKRIYAAAPENIDGLV